MKHPNPPFVSPMLCGNARSYFRWLFSSIFMALVLLGASNASATPNDFPAQSFFDVFVDIQVGNGPVVGQWEEVQVPPSGPPIVEITDNTGSSETLSNVGFFLSPTLIPLEDLNNFDIPPGSNGYPGTNPLPQYDGTRIGPGHSESISLPDESPTFALLSLAAIGLLVFQRRLQSKYS